MNRRLTFARIALGLVFLAFGFDGLFHFFPLPPMPPRAQAVIDALIGYRLFYAVKVLEIVSAVLLLTNRFVSVAVLVLAPILFNIVWFDLNLDPASLPVGLALAALEAALLWARRDALAPLLRARP